MFITIEGIEGSGKSTFTKGLAKRLEAEGKKVLITREPGGCRLGKGLRALLLDAEQPLHPRAELLLFLADRAQHVEEIIRPALEQGFYVLCDRYSDSTLAYQGYGRGMNMNELRSLTQSASGGLEPDLTFLLDISIEQGLARVRKRTDASAPAKDRFESEETAFHERIRQGFLSLAQSESRYRILDAALPPEEIVERAMKEFSAAVL